MRILLIHPNYHSGGAEIAGNWPPAWAAYLAGALKTAGFTDIRSIDAMTDHLSDDDLRAIVAEEKPDVIGATAITPSIYRAERVLQIAKELHPAAVTILGGMHAIFMYQLVLHEAPWIDAIVRGEGEEVLVELVRAIDEGRWPTDRDKIKGIAFADAGGREGRAVATQAAATVKNLDAINPDWGILEWAKYTYIPLNHRVGFPIWRVDVHSRVRSVRSGSLGATTGSAIPRRWSMKSKLWSKNMASGFSSSPTRSRRSTVRNSSSSAKN